LRFLYPWFAPLYSSKLYENSKKANMLSDHPAQIPINKKQPQNKKFSTKWQKMG